MKTRSYNRFINNLIENVTRSSRSFFVNNSKMTRKVLSGITKSIKKK